MHRSLQDQTIWVPVTRENQHAPANPAHSCNIRAEMACTVKYAHDRFGERFRTSRNLNSMM